MTKMLRLMMDESRHERQFETLEASKAHEFVLIVVIVVESSLGMLRSILRMLRRRRLGMFNDEVNDEGRQT